MDVAFERGIRAIAIGSLFVLGCAKPPSNSVVYEESAPECQGSTIPHQYLVRWANHRVTKVVTDKLGAFMIQLSQSQTGQSVRIEQDRWVTPPYTKSNAAPESDVPDNWGVERINAPAAWQKGIYGDGVIVAVVDSGIDKNHPQLKNQIAVNLGESGVDESGADRRTNGIDDEKNGFIDDYAGYNFALNSNNVADSIGHGSHVAGIIAAEHHDTHIQKGYVQGVAPKAKILPVAFIGSSGGGSLSDAISGINYAVQMGAKVINASWGGAPCSQSSRILQSEIASLAGSGVIIVVASGNDGINVDQSPEYPAAYNLSSQITVGATGVFDGMAEFSNYGDVTVHLFAPGVAIISTFPNSSYASLDGTSMATPFVTGAVALMLSENPKATASQIRETLYKSAFINKSYRNASRGRLDLGLAIPSLP